MQSFSRHHSVSAGSLCSGRLCVIPAKICMVAKLTGLDEVSDGEYNAKDDADSCDDDVGNSKEGVLSTHDGARAD